MLTLFFFTAPATTEIYTLSLHDALPISGRRLRALAPHRDRDGELVRPRPGGQLDRKSTRLNSSHSSISYAVFCLKKKKFTTDNSDDIFATIYLRFYKNKYAPSRADAVHI